MPGQQKQNKNQGKNKHKNVLYKHVFRSTFKYLKLLLKHVGLKQTVKTKEKMDLQNLMDFISYHTKESGDLDHNMGLFIKNKSGKRKLSRGGDWSWRMSPNPCVECKPLISEEWYFFPLLSLHANICQFDWPSIGGSNKIFYLCNVRIFRHVMIRWYFTC